MFFEFGEEEIRTLPHPLGDSRVGSGGEQRKPKQRPDGESRDRALRQCGGPASTGLPPVDGNRR